MGKKKSGFIAILALGGIALIYIAMYMDFSKLGTGELWALAGIGAVMLGMICVLIIRTESHGGNSEK